MSIVDIIISVLYIISIIVSIGIWIDRIKLNGFDGIYYVIGRTTPKSIFLKIGRIGMVILLIIISVAVILIPILNIPVSYMYSDILD